MSFTAINNLNLFLATGAIFLQFLALSTLLIFFFGPKKNVLLEFIQKHFLFLGFLISLFSMIFSLVYSEIIGYLACTLCWYQRIFLFPQVFIFATALWRTKIQENNLKNKKENDKENTGKNLFDNRGVFYFSFPMVLIGFSIALYQTIIYYLGDSSNIPCDASGVSCYQRLVSVFDGYISIPTLSLTAFVAILVLLLVVYFYEKRSLSVSSNFN